MAEEPKKRPRTRKTAEIGKTTPQKTAPRKRTPKKSPEELALLASRQLAIDLARHAQDRHCRNIVILEVAKDSPVAKHFLIATGTSDPQLRSVAREFEGLAAEQNFPLFGHAGMQQGRWVVLDFVDIVVHLFDAEFRQFYDLEMLWGDAPKIDWSR